MPTTIRKLRVVSPAPAPRERTVFQLDENPALAGCGPLTLTCGSCEAALADGVWPDTLFDLGIVCADCGAFNDTPSALGFPVGGEVAYFPVGTYRLCSTFTARRGGIIAGEAFPGAGPPRDEGVVARRAPLRHRVPRE